MAGTGGLPEGATEAGATGGDEAGGLGVSGAVEAAGAAEAAGSGDAEAEAEAMGVVCVG